ncbi:calnexin, partial [Trifolium medium]|nr:calnexin [Trifolium medium]
MGERKPIPLGIFAVIFFVISTSSLYLLHASDDVYDATFYESFDEDFDGRWIVSEKDEYN